MAAALAVALAAVNHSLFSRSWYRVALLKPRLHSHVQIHRHTYRGEDWFILQDHFTGRHHRFSPEAYQIIGLLDGRLTLGEIWETACARLGEHMPTQDEVIGLLAQLHHFDLLNTGTLPDFDDMGKRRSRGRSSRLWQSLRSPLSIPLPLFDPERLLNRAMPWVRPLLGWTGAAIWLVTVGAALILGGLHWNDLCDNVSDHILSLQNIAMIGLIYPLVKVAHEFGHAVMVKRWGGEVHEMGVMLLVLMPIPYVDASASLSFRDKRQRMLVGAAGIMVELFIAALAMLVWVNIEPGAARAVAFNLMLIAGVSTVLFNGNPLVRFDAYYVLADYLEIPNMGSRSTRYITYLLQKHLLGSDRVESPANNSGEAWRMGVYATLAFVYRLFLSVRIILFIAGKFFVVGIVLAGWAGVSMIALPLFKAGKFLLKDSAMQRRRTRLTAVVLLPLCLLIGSIFFLPLPLFTTAQGVIWAPEESKVYAAADGFVEQTLEPSGARVEPGTPLARCQDPELAAKVKQLVAQREEYQARHQQSRMTDLAEAAILQEEIARIEAELVRARERAEDLLIKSSRAGIFILPDEADLPGRFVHRGTPLGYVLDQSSPQVRVLVPQEDIDRIRSQTRAVTVRLAERRDRALTARIERHIPAATHQLPSMALSLDGGGLFALDPAHKDKAQVFERLFQLDLQIEQPAADRINERVYVRFEHPPEPLGRRWYRALRRLVMNRFEA